MLIPFVTLLLFGVLTYYVIGPVMSDVMGGLRHFLNTIPPSMKMARPSSLARCWRLIWAGQSTKPPGSSASRCWKIYLRLVRHCRCGGADAARRGRYRYVSCAEAIYPAGEGRRQQRDCGGRYRRYRTRDPLCAGRAAADDYRQYALRRHCRHTSLKKAVEQGGSYLGENPFGTLIGLLEAQQQQAMTLSADAVCSLLQRVPGAASLNIIDAQLIDNITGHLLRCVSAPIWLPEHRQSSMNNLKSAWPAAFDMSLPPGAASE